MAYELCLCDSALSKLVEKLYTVHIMLLKIWGEYDEKTAALGRQHPNLFCYLPENFLSDLIDSFTEILKSNTRPSKVFSKETVIAVFEFCIILIRTDGKTITQPYVKANALELINYFLYSDEKGELTSEFAKSPVISSKIMETVVKFYVDIEFAGQGMFFTKFQFRHSCSQIFRRFWK